MRGLARAYPLFFAVQLLFSWTAYGAGLSAPARRTDGAAASLTASRGPALASSAPDAARAGRTQGRRARAPWHRRLAVLARSRFPFLEQPGGAGPSAPVEPPAPDRAPPEHPPA